MSTARVVIVGGGPGGSVCAARLCDRGLSVLVLEKTKHPRFHLGESLLPQSLGVFHELGLLEVMRERFIIKRGATFHEEGTGKTSRYSFDEAYGTRAPVTDAGSKNGKRSWDHAFEVPRDEFDELLLRHAAARGADVREEWTGVRVRMEGGRAVGVDATDPGGRAHALAADFVVDATGRDAMMAHASKGAQRIPTLDKTAFFAHFRGTWRDVGPKEGDIQIVLFRGGWFWVIPFKDGRTSVGAVCGSGWVREQRGGPKEHFARAVSETPVVQRMLEGATQLMDAEATADFSFRVRDASGDGWIAVGDAGGFIDPLFSTGAHLAMCGGLAGADAIADALAAGDVSRGRFAAWEDYVKRGTDLFVGAVQAFYRGNLIPYLFADPQHPYMRRAITSMLAGDVFDQDIPWARDMRTRFPAEA
jgi:flavin-dependent dehydrogenase